MTSEIEKRFDIDLICKTIVEHKFNKIALQFPDSLLVYSNQISQLISTNIKKLDPQNTTERVVFVLGDTSYGECCVDEVNAEHYNSNVVVHFGRSCLSLTSRLPVILDFGKNLDFDVETFESNLESLIQQNQKQFGNSKILLFYDVEYSWKLTNRFSSQTNKRFGNQVVCTHAQSGFILPIKKQSNTINNNDNNNEHAVEIHSSKLNNNLESFSSTIYLNSTNSSISNNVNENGNNNSNNQSFKVNGRTFEMTRKDLESALIIYIGKQDSLLMSNLILSFSRNKVLLYDVDLNEFPEASSGQPIVSKGIPKAVMKRFFLIEKAKDADIIGIVVGTLGVAHYLEILRELKKTITKAGKKFYTFVLGKLNVAKLANFAEVDLFVLVGCAENSLIDSKEFFKPILTPFELEVALKPKQFEMSQFSTDFSALLNVAQQTTSNDENDETKGEEDDSLESLSMLSGKIRNNKQSTITKTTTEKEESNLSGTELEKKRNGELISTENLVTAASLFSKRTFTGLEQFPISETGEKREQSLNIVEGRVGIPQSYTHETHQK